MDWYGCGAPSRASAAERAQLAENRAIRREVERAQQAGKGRQRCHNNVQGDGPGYYSRSGRSSQATPSQRLTTPPSIPSAVADEDPTGSSPTLLKKDFAIRQPSTPSPALPIGGATRVVRGATVGIPLRPSTQFSLHLVTRCQPCHRCPFWPGMLDLRHREMIFSMCALHSQPYS